MYIKSIALFVFFALYGRGALATLPGASCQQKPFIMRFSTFALVIIIATVGGAAARNAIEAKVRGTSMLDF